MSIIAVNSASFCDLDDIVDQVSSRTSCRIMGDHDLIYKIAENSEEVSSIQKIFMDKTRPRGRLLQKKKLILTRIKTVLAQTLLQDNVLLHGLCSMLIPNDIHHVLRVGIIGDEPFRTSRAIEKTGKSHAEARKLITDDDTLVHSWAEATNFGDPWDPEKYDLFIPVHKKSLSQAVESVIRYSTSSVLCKDNRSMNKAADFLLASQVELALIMEGHEVKVKVYGQEIVLSIPKNIILLQKLEEELKEIVLKIPGVKKVSTELSDFQKERVTNESERSKNKLLLVDDEREFVHTLSERLLMREIGSDVVYDGEQALTYVEEENPGVIVLDLKMPGINGVEVLRRVKSMHPDIEIIILSGHGSKEDQKKCLELGAAAYLEKPVDIDKLISLVHNLKEKDHNSEHNK